MQDINPWSQDKYAPSWQIAQTAQQPSDPDKKQSNWVMQALLQRGKRELQGFKKAAVA